MRRKYNCISVFIMICMLSACGKQGDGYVLVNYNEISNVSEETKEQKYIEYLTNEVKQAFADRDDIKDMDIEITCNTDAWNVTVKIDRLDSLSDTDKLNQSIEEALRKFFPEGTTLSIVAQ